MSLSTQCAIETSSVRPVKKMMGSHSFTIMGHFLDKDTSKGKYLESTVFNIGGYDWSIRYYPNGSDSANYGDISIYLFLKNNAGSAKGQVSFTILNKSGTTFVTDTIEITIYDGCGNTWGFPSFVRRAELESKIKEDCFIIKCVVTIFKEFPVEPTETMVVPPGNILQQLGQLLEERNGADVTFEVDGQTFNAHKFILAARSPVFSAQFFGSMKEKSDTRVKIKEMEAPVFKALLYFIYTELVPEFNMVKKGDEKSDVIVMAQHLLVAADRYGLGRLKIICEKLSMGNIDKSNVVSLLDLAERHNCKHLKTSCLKFLFTIDSFEELQESFSN